MSGIEAKVIAHSVSTVTRKPIVTMQLRYPRFIHSEFMTHRVFSRNASSSRAIPVSKMLKQVWSDPASPVHWGTNQPGMQARQELTGWRLWIAKQTWRLAGKAMCCVVWPLTKIGGHKQWVNRLLEPWQWIHVIFTATELENFFELRDHPDAQPEFRVLAKSMAIAYLDSDPQVLERGQWHLPYVGMTDFKNLGITPNMKFNHHSREFMILLKVSAARCARVSYLTHDGQEPSIEADLALYERLVGSTPLHASPVEHQATPDIDSPHLHGNFKDWMQFRKVLELAANEQRQIAMIARGWT